MWLLFELTKREFTQRYKGTLLGMLWPVLYSFAFIAIYILVFSHIVKIRWDAGATSGPLMIFCGLTPYLFFAEVVSRSPGVVWGGAALVKKVRFPVSLLPISAVNSASILALVNVFFLLVFGWWKGEITPFAPFILLAALVPLYLFCLGLSLLLSSLGVYFRDLGQMMPLFVQAIMFLSPIFYPESIFSGNFRYIAILNPMTYFIRLFRSSMGGEFDFALWGILIVVNVLFVACAAFIFKRLRPGFGDIL